MIQGSGSTWAATRSTLGGRRHANGIKVVFTSTAPPRVARTSPTAPPTSGSPTSATRARPGVGAVDTSERGLRVPAHRRRGYPFPYHIGRRQLRHKLRLSGETIAKIFTNQITNWDDPEITADNNGRALPSCRSSPSSTRRVRDRPTSSPHIAKQYPSLWKNGADRVLPAPGAQVAQNGSASSTTSPQAGNGAIGYDEYSYALGAHYPVVYVLNKSGYFTLPTQYNVAVALTQAIINSNTSNPRTTCSRTCTTSTATPIRARTRSRPIRTRSSRPQPMTRA